MVDTIRLNVGCGDYRLEGWINIDAAVSSAADLNIEVPPLPWNNASVSEIYAGHFLEHLGRVPAASFLDECWRVLEPGGRLGILVPDMREWARRYVLDEWAPMEFPAGHHRDLRDLDDACDALIFSTVQASVHHWAYDKFTLSRALTQAGFVVDGEFDRFRDPRLSTGQWYQIGIDCHKP